MMRQAVPLLRCESPIIGTGIEGQLIRDSRTQIISEGEGVIEFVDATTIKIKYVRSEEEEFVSFDTAVKTYTLPKFLKTNQNTTIDLRPIVKKGDKVKKGQVLAIVEAMKLMNEIESEFDGTVKAILVKNGDLVEFDQPMFVIE